MECGLLGEEKDYRQKLRLEIKEVDGQ